MNVLTALVTKVIVTLLWAGTVAVAQPAQPAPAPASKPQLQAQPAPPVKLDAEWSCKTFALDERGQAAGELSQALTVGTVFLLVCEGNSVVLARDRLGLELPKAQKYALRLLGVRGLTDVRAEFLATTWMAGQIKLVNPVLSDGSAKVGLGTIELNVSSVVDPKTNPEGKPFPPLSAMLMPWPTWIWIALGAVLCLLTTLLVFAIYRRIQHKRFLNLLASHPITLKPYHQFNKELRRLNRELPLSEAQLSDERVADFLRELDQALRWYIARELVVPAIDRSPREVVRAVLRVNERLHSEIRRDLGVVLTELQKAMAQKKLAITDAHQLMDLARGVADRVSSSREREA